MKFWIFLALLAPAFAQEKKIEPAAHPAAPAAKPASGAAETPDEMRELGRALAEGGNSPQDYIRVLEAHLAKHPNSTHSMEIYRVLAKASLEAHDDARIIKYGELVLVADPTDAQLLERISRAYVMRGDKSNAEKGLVWAKKYEQEIAKLRATSPPGRISAGQWSEDLDKAAARAFVLEARAYGVLDQKQAAIEAAGKSWASYPSSEAAREWSKLDAASEHSTEAIEHLADAFTIDDSLNTAADREKDRRRMGELYTKANGSEKGLGDLILRSYDRTSNLLSDKSAKLQSADPNVKANSILDFTLPGANGKDLKLGELKGKTIVFDFWATWCGPCKVQRPLYEQVQETFKSNPNVVFLSINTDEDRKLVPDFLKTQKWTHPVYYDGGLSEYMKVTSIPTTLIVNRDGQIASRMNGFIPEKFVSLLAARIQDTLR